MADKHTYDLLQEMLTLVQKNADERIRKVIHETVDAHDEAWYDLLMHGTDGASDKSLELLGYTRTRAKDKL